MSVSVGLYHKACLYLT